MAEDDQEMVSAGDVDDELVDDEVNSLDLSHLLLDLLSLLHKLHLLHLLLLHSLHLLLLYHNHHHQLL